MDWNGKGIGQAIQEAKAKGTLFVVAIYGEGDDGKSSEFMRLLDDPGVVGKLSGTVAIKLIYDTEPFKQFSQLYPVLLVPSIYFIDSTSGVDLEVTGGPKVTLESLNLSIDKAFAGKGGAATASSVTGAEAASSTNTASPPTQSPDKEEMKEDGKSKESLEERVKKAKLLLEKRRTTASEDEENKVKNSEIERRSLGKSLQEYKRQQEADSIQNMADQRRMEKEEERIARERVKAQIAQDRAEKTERFNQLRNDETERRKEAERKTLEKQADESERLSAVKSSQARVQFRLPDGRTQTRLFEAGDTLADAYAFVSGQMSTGFGNSFSLSTAFPRRQLDAEPRSATLREVGLVPSGSVMVQPRPSSSALVGGEGFMAYLWLLLTPVTVLWSFLQSILFSSGSSSGGGSAPGDQGKSEAPQNPSSGRQRASFKRDGNIARLRNEDDDDDETNTYNGNSTQQM